MMFRFVLAVAVGLASTVPAVAQSSVDLSPVVVTTGHAVLKRAPDLAWVSIATETRAQTPAEAQRLAAEAMIAAQAALARTGLPDGAIRTTSYTMQPDMQYVEGRARVRGYIARNQIEVRVEDLSRLAGVIDAAGSSGATSMSNLRFDLKERAGVEREALRLAVQDALERARAMVAGAGASLGAIVRVEEQRDMISSAPMMAMRAESAAQSQTPIVAGEIEIEARVSLTVGIR